MVRMAWQVFVILKDIKALKARALLMLAELPEQFLGYYVVDPLLKWLAKAVFHRLALSKA